MVQHLLYVQAGKTLLFIASVLVSKLAIACNHLAKLSSDAGRNRPKVGCMQVGDNFYWTGVTPEVSAQELFFWWSGIMLIIVNC